MLLWSLLCVSLKRSMQHQHSLILCWQSSPDVFIPKHRSSDLEAIARVIQEANHFIYISITDYLPLIGRNTSRLEQICCRTVTWQAFITRGLSAVFKLRMCRTSCMPNSACICICAKVLVAYRQPYKRGFDPEEFTSPSADKLLGKDSSANFQLHLVPEESVHGAGQLLTRSCKFRANMHYFHLYRYSLSKLTA